MSFQFRRRGDVREQSAQQEPFFQNASGQQPFVEPAGYPQMGQPQGYDPQLNNNFNTQAQQPPQHMQNMPMQPSFSGPQQPQFFPQKNYGGFYDPRQAGPHGNMQAPQQPTFNVPSQQPYFNSPQQFQHPEIMYNQSQTYVHPVQASQLSGKKVNFENYSNPQAHPAAVSHPRPEDVRSLSFWQETQTNSGFEEPDNDAETNSPVRLLVAVTGVALIAGLSWFAYKWAKSPSSDTPPLIHAEPGPHKVSPDHRGGINIPYQDKLIYDRIGDGNSEEPAERLLPPPEKPLMNSPHIPQQNDQVQQNTPQSPMYSEMQSHSTTAPQQQGYVDHSQLQHPQNQMQQPAVLPTTPQLSVTESTVDKQVTSTSQEAEPEVISSVNKTKPIQTLNGNFFVQLATVKSEAAALREWKRLQAKYNLKGMKSQIRESETTDGEIVYRLLMGPFDEKVKAMKHAIKIDGTKVVHITE